MTSDTQPHETDAALSPEPERLLAEIHHLEQRLKTLTSMEKSSRLYLINCYRRAIIIRQQLLREIPFRTPRDRPDPGGKSP